MLEHMPRRSRSLLCLSMTFLALALSVLAFCTSYWCEGTQKVVKPLCLSPVKMEKCSQNSSQPFEASMVQPDCGRMKDLQHYLDGSGEEINFFFSDEETSAPTHMFFTAVLSQMIICVPKFPSNDTVSPNQREALIKTRQTQLANAVQYIWETGEDKYMFRYFHAGFWESCEKHVEGERCRRFLDLTPEDTHGVLLLSMISEFIYISLLGMGFLLMWLDVLCSHKELHALKINAFAALCTVLSGLIGMVAHMMYTTVFQLTVIVGPKDWRPQNWDYGWSFAMAWLSFSCCMGAAVLTFNSYTKTIIEIRHRKRLHLEEACAAPSYEEVVSGGGIYSISGLQQCPDGMIDSTFLEHETVGVKAEVDVPMMVLIGGCEPEECEDCKREIDEMEEAMKRE